MVSWQSYNQSYLSPDKCLLNEDDVLLDLDGATEPVFS